MLPRIAVVEDDVDLLDTTIEYLRTQGYSAWGAASAEAFYKRFATDAVDVVVLDVGLPDEDGISVARHLRDLPRLTVIIVSARDTLDDRLAGLKAGADRYLVKPVNLIELVANIETVSRRPAAPTAGAEAEQPADECASHEPWHLGKNDWGLTEPDGKLIRLTAREFFLLNCLFEAKGVVVARKALIAEIYGTHVPNGGERLDVLVARLRKKCVASFGQNLPVKTVHQVGYMFTAPSLVE